MKINRVALSLLKSFLIVKNKRDYKNHPSRNEFRSRINIPYIDDGNEYHTYDVYLADESNRKHCCIIDIHGGSYIFGNHRYNYPYAYYLLKNGFDVVLLDYEPNNGKKDIYDLLSDCCSNLKHLKEHLKDFNLDKDSFVISGDSAGGHIALLLSLISQSEEVSKITKLILPEFDFKATVLSCPVYNFKEIASGGLTDGAAKRMLGPKYNDKEHLEKYSPKTYIEYNKLPLFVSTSNHDFLRSETMLLVKDIEGHSYLKFVDIQTENKEADHVHNVTKIKLKESIEVNDAIVKFIDDLI